MARTIKELEAQTDARFNELQETLNHVASAVKLLADAALAADQAKQPQVKESKPKKADKPWLEACPDYATDAQRAEYDKLAKRAAEQRDAVMTALGTKSVKAFIPVPKRDQTRMPHTIQWSAMYSK
jgi:hypothetical protein